MSVHTDSKKVRLDAAVAEEDEEDSAQTRGAGGEMRYAKSNPTLALDLDTFRTRRPVSVPETSIDQFELAKQYGFDQPFLPHQINRKVERAPKFKRGQIDFS